MATKKGRVESILAPAHPTVRPKGMSTADDDFVVAPIRATARGLVPCSVKGIYAVFVLVLNSSARTRRLELSIGRRRWSPRENNLDTIAEHTIGRSSLMRIQDPRTLTYITPTEPQNGSWLPSRTTARDEAATTGQRPAHLRTSEHLHRRDFRKTKLMWCARQDAFASLHFSVGHLPLQRKPND